MIIKFPAEWHHHDFVQLTWPHINTDWADNIDEARLCFKHIATEIAKRQMLLIVTPEPDAVRNYIQHDVQMQNVRFATVDSNDTWARDHGGITVFEDDKPVVLDFQFNGWGLKFAADKDNLITERLGKLGVINAPIRNCRNFVFEGGSIESDGHGTLLTTAECLLSPNRNPLMSRLQIQNFLLDTFGAYQVLWLDNGYLAGDDTDSHIDTLARLCPNDTMVYVKCEDKSDEHYEALSAMEQQIMKFRTLKGKPYNLVPLPMAAVVMNGEERLPATYANYLVMNEAVLMPTYNNAELDNLAMKQLKIAFPQHEIIGVECLTLIKQHGSLHCVTMQYPFPL